MTVQEGSAARRRIEAAAIQLFSERGSTRITVQELAKAAGVARGTIYNNVESTELLFERTAARLAEEMHRRVTASLGVVEDPATFLAHDMRFFVRRAHHEPAWGRFVYRFGLSDDTLRELLNGVPARAMAKGQRLGRYAFRDELLPGVMAMLVGTTLSAMWLVLEGHQTWREAGSCAAELVLRAIGMPADDAREVAWLPLPELAPDSSL